MITGLPEGVLTTDLEIIPQNANKKTVIVP